MDRKGDCSELDLCHQTLMDVTTVVTDRESKDEDIVTMSWRGVKELVTPARHEEKGGVGGTKAHIWRLEGTSPRPAEYLCRNDRRKGEREAEGGRERGREGRGETRKCPEWNGLWRRRLR